MRSKYMIVVLICFTFLCMAASLSISGMVSSTNAGIVTTAVSIIGLVILIRKPKRKPVHMPKELEDYDEAK